MASSGSSGVQTVRPSYVRAKQTAARAALQRVAKVSSQGVEIEQRRRGHESAGRQREAAERIVREVARFAADSAREVRCVQRQLGADWRYVRVACAGPCLRRHQRSVEQRAIVIDEPPPLFAAEPRREIAEIRAGAGAEIDDFERRCRRAAWNASA